MHMRTLKGGHFIYNVALHSCCAKAFVLTSFETKKFLHLEILTAFQLGQHIIFSSSLHLKASLKLYGALMFLLLGTHKQTGQRGCAAVTGLKITILWMPRLCREHLIR